MSWCWDKVGLTTPTELFSVFLKILCYVIADQPHFQELLCFNPEIKLLLKLMTALFCSM